MDERGSAACLPAATFGWVARYGNSVVGSGMNHDAILKYFTTDHLPADLQKVSNPFRDLAQAIAASGPPSEERAVSLRKLLESKDAAVRAALPEGNRGNK